MKQKLITFSKIILFYFIIALSSCEKEALTQENSTPVISSAKNWFEDYKSKQNFYFVFKNLAYDWNNASTTKLTDGSMAVTVPVIENTTTSKNNTKKILYLYPQKDTKDFGIALFELISNKNEQNDFDLNNFDGYIINWDLVNGSSKCLQFDNSYSTNEINIKVINTKSIIHTSITGRQAVTPPCNDEDCMAGGGSTDPFTFTGTNQLANVIVQSSGTKPNITVTIVGVPNGLNGSGNAGSFIHSPQGGSSGSSAAHSIEQNIDDTKLDPCPKQIMDKLKNATNCDIKNVLEKLGAEKGINLTIKSEATTNGRIGQTTRTTPNVKYDYTIKISKDYTSGTQLFKAHAILHELVHAFFMSLNDDYSTSGNPAVYIEFPELFQKYVDKNWPGTGDVHHTEMAKVYVNAIGSALQEFQTGVAVPYGTIPNQVYTDMAWYGINDTQAFSNLPEAERKRMENRYKCENNGSYYQGQTAIGKPCN
jgi:hypothetical protein